MSENIPNSFPKFWDHNSILEWGDYIYGIASVKLSPESMKLFDEYDSLIYENIGPPENLPEVSEIIKYYRKLLQKFLELYNIDNS